MIAPVPRPDDGVNSDAVTETDDLQRATTDVYPEDLYPKEDDSDEAGENAAINDPDDDLVPNPKGSDNVPL